MPRATKKAAAPAETDEQKQARINARLAELDKRHKVLAQQVEDIVAEDEQLKAEAAELLDNKEGTYDHDGGQVRIGPNHRFDQETAREVLTELSPDILKVCLIEVIDSKKAKDLLPPATYRKCMKDGAKKKVQFL